MTPALSRSRAPTRNFRPTRMRLTRLPKQVQNPFPASDRTHSGGSTCKNRGAGHGPESTALRFTAWCGLAYVEGEAQSELPLPC